MRDGNRSWSEIGIDKGIHPQNDYSMLGTRPQQFRDDGSGMIDWDEELHHLQLEGDHPVMSTHASVLVDSVGPPSAEVCRTAASFP
jgi:hypothetical protein